MGLLKSNKIYGFNLPIFAGLALIVLFAAYWGFSPAANVIDSASDVPAVKQAADLYAGFLPGDYVGTIAYLMVIGGIFFYLGNKIPVLNDYMGLATVLPLFGSSALVFFNLIPLFVKDNIKTFMSGGFQNLYIAAILVGSILSLDRKTMLGSVARYIPTIVGSQIFAILFLALAGMVTGVGAGKAIFFVGAPTMSGGSAGAIATLPAMYSDIMKDDSFKAMSGMFLGFTSIANVISILSGALFNKLGPRVPKLNGNGKLLMDSPDHVFMEAKSAKVPLDLHKLGAGLFISLAFMVGGTILGEIVPQIHALAWMIILAIAAKSLGLINEAFCDMANDWFQFMLKNLLPTLIAGIGIASMDISKIWAYFTLKYFFIIIMGIAGAVVGAMLFGRLLKLWPIEASITAALCSCDVGGSGDIAILSAANRMQLLPFSSISTRIGGALMILEISLLMPLFVPYLASGL